MSRVSTASLFVRARIPTKHNSLTPRVFASRQGFFNFLFSKNEKRHSQENNIVPLHYAPAPALPHPTLRNPTLLNLTLPYLTLPYPTLPYPTLPYPTLPYSALPYPTLPSPTVPYPTLPYPTLPYLTVPYPHVQCQSGEGDGDLNNLNEPCTQDGEPAPPKIHHFVMTVPRKHSPPSSPTHGSPASGKGLRGGDRGRARLRREGGDSVGSFGSIGSIGSGSGSGRPRGGMWYTWRRD